MPWSAIGTFRCASGEAVRPPAMREQGRLTHATGGEADLGQAGR